MLKKNGKSFWNCWNSKFASHSKWVEVDGCVDANIIVEKFADHFSKCYVAHNMDRANRLFDDYVKLRENYIGLPSNCNGTFDAELMDNIISSLGRGKAAGKPRNGPIFEKRQSSRLLYRKKFRENQSLTKEFYSNDLHDALLKKNGKSFWNCWSSKFASHSK